MAQADRRAGAAIDAALGDELSEPRVAAELGALLPAEATLVVASSMPVRDVETFFAVRDAPPRVLSNRGANGIDGTLADRLRRRRGQRGPGRRAARRRRASPTTWRRCSPPGASACR